MNYRTIEWNDISVVAQLSEFNAKNGIAERHVVFQITHTALNAKNQYNNIQIAIKRLANTEEFKNSVLIWERYFVSDAINQAGFIPQDSNKAVSIVQQPMLNNTKVAVWAYFVENARIVTKENNTVVMEHSGYTHYYTTQMHSRKKDEALETADIFNHYTNELAKWNCTLKDNCIRTWIYVHGVDVHYGEMVKTRKDFFEQEGLTDSSHYIASTGIEGKYMYPDSIVSMDAYAVKGIKQDQITYLQGLSHLNPTIEYGVTFERATAVDYGDRRHIYISGTASINNKGEIVHPLNIEKQIDRTIENIQVLLKEGDASIQDVVHMIVYLRDTADYELVNQYMETHYANIPKVILWAPVCRPGWLIEIECMAIKAIENTSFDKF